MATVRTGPPKTEAVPVELVIREAVDLFTKGIDPRGGQVTVQGPPPGPRLQVLVDPGRLIQVLLSLFGNAQEAIQTTRNPGRITLHTRSEAADGREWAHIDVMDNGPGIREEYRDRIFEPGFTSGKKGGTGFGLYLANQNVIEQGGRLSVRNLPEGGACFTVMLPARRSPARRPAAEHRSGEAAVRPPEERESHGTSAGIQATSLR